MLWGRNPSIINPAWEEHPYSATTEKAQTEGLNSHLHTRRVWDAACLHLPVCVVHLGLRGPPGAKVVLVLLLAFWLKLETFLNLCSRHRYYTDCPSEVIPARCHLRWVHETQHSWEGRCTSCGVFTPDVSEPITLFPTSHAHLVPPRECEIQNSVILLQAPLKLQHVCSRDLRFSPFYVLVGEVKLFGLSCNPLTSCTSVSLESACSRDPEEALINVRPKSFLRPCHGATRPERLASETLISWTKSWSGLFMEQVFPCCCIGLCR